MKINNITPVSFGYSKKSQEYLDKSCKQLGDDDVSSTVLSLSDLCNKVEDEIVLGEKMSPQGAYNSPLIDFFVGLKEVLVTNVLDLFNDGDKYVEFEHDYYQKEMNKTEEKAANWRMGLISTLEWWVPSLAPMDTNENLNEKVVINDNVPKLEDKSKTKTEKTKNNIPTSRHTDKEVLEILKPTEFSPKSFEDIKGMEDLKAELREEIIEPVNHPELAKLNLEEYGKRVPSGVLLYGPPGCGKTFIVQALAAELDTPVYLMNVGSIGSQLVNGTSNNIKAAFDYIQAEAKDSDKPVILFMDEMESLSATRGGTVSGEDDKSVATLLVSIEQAKANNVIIVGATNRYDMIDPAIRRRFDVKRYAGPPEEEQRIELLKSNLGKKKKGQKLSADEEAVKKIAKALEGYSYHSINTIADDASKNAMKRGRADISSEDFKLAIEKTSEEKIQQDPYRHKSKNSIGFSSSAL